MCDGFEVGYAGVVHVGVPYVDQYNECFDLKRIVCYGKSCYIIA
jgi:hypothetical protein